MPLNFLYGPTPGAKGDPGADGTDGSSAFELAVANGFVGTESQWLASLVGAQGPDGPQGTTGPQGIQGVSGAPGTRTYSIVRSDNDTSAPDNEELQSANLAQYGINAVPVLALGDKAEVKLANGDELNLRVTGLSPLTWTTVYVNNNFYISPTDSYTATGNPDGRDADEINSRLAAQIASDNHAELIVHGHAYCAGKKIAVTGTPNNPPTVKIHGGRNAKFEWDLPSLGGHIVGGFAFGSNFDTNTYNDYYWPDSTLTLSRTNEYTGLVTIPQGVDRIPIGNMVPANGSSTFQPGDVIFLTGTRVNPHCIAYSDSGWGEWVLISWVDDTYLYFEEPVRYQITNEVEGGGQLAGASIRYAHVAPRTDVHLDNFEVHYDNMESEADIRKSESICAIGIERSTAVIEGISSLSKTVGRIIGMNGVPSITIRYCDHESIDFNLIGSSQMAWSGWGVRKAQIHHCTFRGGAGHGIDGNAGLSVGAQMSVIMPQIVDIHSNEFRGAHWSNVTTHAGGSGLWVHDNTFERGFNAQAGAQSHINFRAPYCIAERNIIKTQRIDQLQVNRMRTGRVNIAGGYSVGATSMTLDGVFSGWSKSNGTTFIVNRNYDQVYTVTGWVLGGFVPDEGEYGVLSFSPGLIENVNDNDYIQHRGSHIWDAIELTAACKAIDNRIDLYDDYSGIVVYGSDCVVDGNHIEGKATSRDDILGVVVASIDNTILKGNIIIGCDRGLSLNSGTTNLKMQGGLFAHNNTGVYVNGASGVKANSVGFMDNVRDTEGAAELHDFGPLEKRNYLEPPFPEGREYHNNAVTIPSTFDLYSASWKLAGTLFFNGHPTPQSTLVVAKAGIDIEYVFGIRPGAGYFDKFRTFFPAQSSFTFDTLPSFVVGTQYEWALEFNHATSELTATMDGASETVAVTETGPQDGDWIIGKSGHNYLDGWLRLRFEQPVGTTQWEY